jgi:hypothetical protein
VLSISDLDLVDLDNFSRFVLEANKVRTSDYAKAILMDAQHATNETRKLWESIYFLGRLPRAFERMAKVLLTFPSFEKVRFVPLPKANTTVQPLNDPLGLEKVLFIAHSRQQNTCTRIVWMTGCPMIPTFLKFLDFRTCRV